MTSPISITPAARARGAKAYQRSPFQAVPGEPVLRLDANEGPASLAGKLTSTVDAARLRVYPDASELEDTLARRLRVPAERLLVTAGGDDALQRVCQAVLEPGAAAIATTPTFEMIPRYAALAGGDLREVPWMRGEFPVQQVLDAVTPSTRAIFVVTPNNPTGGVATAQDLRRLSAAAPGCLLVVDLAYTELADVDLTDVAISLPNTILVRTFSKAWGLAGLRVGYAAGCERAISLLRAVGQPYAVAGPSAALALHALHTLGSEVDHGIKLVCGERRVLGKMLAAKGFDVLPSQANFVLAGSDRAAEFHGFLRAAGIFVRSFASRPGLEKYLRITCPGDTAAFDRLVTCVEKFQ